MRALMLIISSAILVYFFVGIPVDPIIDGVLFVGFASMVYTTYRLIYCLIRRLI